MLGSVRHPGAASVPAAEIRIMQLQTNQVRTTVSNEDGAFSFGNLAAGTYDVQISKSGFRAVKRSGVPVSINTVSRVDVTLDLGAVSETVNVSATAAILQTDRAEVRAEISAKTLSNLPVPPGCWYSA